MKVVVAAVVAVLAVMSTVKTAHSTAIDDMLYTAVPSQPCVRLLSATGDIGCSTPYQTDGTSGLLFLVDSAARIEEFRALDDGHKRAILLTPTLFTGPVVERLTTPLLAGIVVLPGPRPSALSPSSTTPQGTGGISPLYQWDPHGSDMLQARYEFPIVTVAEAQATSLLADANANHAAGMSTFPQKALNFLFDFGPAGLTSLSCLRNTECLPLGGLSVWGSMGTLNATKKQVLMTANMDSTSMFHDRSYGAASSASDIVAVLAAVDALAKISFALFQGEAWGRMGSRRFVRDIRGFICESKATAAESITGFPICKAPLRTDMSFDELAPDGSSFAHVLAVDQVGAQTPSAYLHTWQAASMSASVLDATAIPSSMPIVASSVSEVPPSPMTSFVQAWPGVSGAVLSSYDTLYSNKFFHSSWDNADNVNVTQVAAFASTLARSAYALAANATSPTAAAAAVPAALVADASLVEKLMHCFTVDATCDTFSTFTMLSTATLRSVAGAGPVSLYTGVNKPARPVTATVDGQTKSGFIINPSLAELTIRSFLAKAAASETGAACTSTSACKQVDQRYECIAGQCIVPTAHYHESLSSALISLGNGGYSLFESELDKPDADPLWSASIGIKSFTAGDPTTDITMLLVGIVVVVASVLLVLVARRKLATHLKVH